MLLGSKVHEVSESYLLLILQRHHFVSNLFLVVLDIVVNLGKNSLDD